VQQAQVDPSINSAITALAAQLEEYHNIVNLETLNLKDNQIQKLSVENEGLQLEIVDYASSTSWKITRPLRRLSRLVRRK
jgi:Leucine-rich repeat (LRR) protein